MNSFLRQATASQGRMLGPYISDTDFKTPQTGLTIANTDIKLSMSGAASASKNSGGGTARSNGMYGVTFDATDTATVGELNVSSVVAGALPVFCTFVVLEEAVYDMLFAASALGYVDGATVDLTKIGGVAQSAAYLKDFADTGYDPSSHKVAGVVLTDTSTALTNAPTAGDFTATMKTSLNAATPSLNAAYDAAKTAAQAGNAMTLTAGERNSTADALLNRNVAGGSSAGRLVKHAFAAQRNKVEIVAGTMTVYDTDDTTPLWDAAITTTAGNPVTAIDPS